jgi:alpha-1,3-mannosyltransferase
VASVCTNLDKNSTFLEQSGGRFTQLGMDENHSTNHQYYFALTFRNSGIHLPTIIDNLLRVIYHLGEQNVFMSVYEGGSNDDGHTTTMIKTIESTLNAIGIEYHVQIEGDGPPNSKNAVLDPLRDMYKSDGRIFNSLVMMGDDLWCAEDLLELLFHSRGQAASIVCSTDVRSHVGPPFLSLLTIYIGRCLFSFPRS